VLARRQAAGEIETAWFTRHGSTPITEVPAHWPDVYREIVERRIEVGAQRFECELNGAAASASLRVFFRPEDVLVRGVNAATPNSAAAVVEKVEFLGAFSRLTFRLNGIDQPLVADLSQSQVDELFDLSLAGRTRHDELLREHRGGYALTFDVLVDLGSFRDLHRHRRCVQVQQPLTWEHAFERPEDVFASGMGPRAALGALEGGLGEAYVDALLKAEQASRVVREVAPLAADYLLPLAYRTRCLFKMDWAEAAYIIEQRTQPQGHFSYRRVAWGMYEALRARHPKLAEPIRAVDPNESLDLLRR